MSEQRLPQTDSIQELARFWDSHDLMDYEDGLEEVGEAVFERATTVQLRLLPEQIEALKRMARARGIDYTDLIREWVVEKVAG
jgi:predicted DNA binding CopG/RHH family protein